MNEKEEKLLKALEDYYDDKDKNRIHVPGKDIIQHAGPYLRKEEFVAAINTLLKEWMVQGENAQKFKLGGVPWIFSNNNQRFYTEQTSPKLEEIEPELNDPTLVKLELMTVEPNVSLERTLTSLIL